MATITLSPHDSLLKLLTTTLQGLDAGTSSIDPSAAVSTIVLPGSTSPITGSNTIATHLSAQLFPEQTYTPIEAAEISQWLSLSAENEASPSKEYLATLNKHLKTRTTILGEKPSVADLAVYVRIREVVRGWDAETRTGGGDGGLRYIVRWLDFVQNAKEVFKVSIPEAEKVEVDVKDVKVKLASEEPVKEKKDKDAAAAEGGKKDKKADKKGDKKTVDVVVPAAAEGKKPEEKGKKDGKKEKEEKKDEAAAAAGGKEGKKAKKEKAPKAPAPKKEETPLSPSLIDLRVGQILKCVPHPNADSLYMSTIICGDAPDSPYITPLSSDPTLPPTTPPFRIVLSGLRGKVPLEEMQGRRVALVCNLKPANMRGIKSSAMVLAASPRGADHSNEVVELVTPPESAQVGDRLVFVGYEEGTPEPQLNPKQKVFELLGPGLGTDSEGVVVFDGAKVFVGKEGDQLDSKLSKGEGRLVVQKSGEVCKVKSLKDAVVR